MADLLQYEGARVVVTGAASGMGAATAALLRDMGAEVHGVDIQRGEAAADHFHLCDLGDPAAIDATVEAIGGQVDSLFNCAGLPTTAPGQQIVRVNFLGHRHLTEALLPTMPAGSSVGFISSAAGMGWQGNIDLLKGLLDTDDFAAGHAWCEDHDDAIALNGYGFSKEAINAYVAWRGLPDRRHRAHQQHHARPDRHADDAELRRDDGRGLLREVPQARRPQLPPRGAGLGTGHA